MPCKHTLRHHLDINTPYRAYDLSRCRVVWEVTFAINTHTSTYSHGRYTIFLDAGEEHVLGWLWPFLPCCCTANIQEYSRGCGPRACRQNSMGLGLQGLGMPCCSWVNIMRPYYLLPLARICNYWPPMRFDRLSMGFWLKVFP